MRLCVLSGLCGFFSCRVGFCRSSSGRSSLAFAGTFTAFTAFASFLFLLFGQRSGLAVVGGETVQIGHAGGFAFTASTNGPGRRTPDPKLAEELLR